MIITEYVQIGGAQFVKHYSDNNVYIRKVQFGKDELYSSAYDPIEFESARTYVETDIQIPPLDD